MAKLMIKSYPLLVIDVYGYPWIPEEYEGTVYKDVVAAIREKLPDVLKLENVARLLHLRENQTLDDVLELVISGDRPTFWVYYSYDSASTEQHRDVEGWNPLFSCRFQRRGRMLMYPNAKECWEEDENEIWYGYMTARGHDNCEFKYGSIDPSNPIFEEYQFAHGHTDMCATQQEAVDDLENLALEPKSSSPVNLSNPHVSEGDEVLSSGAVAETPTTVVSFNSDESQDKRRKCTGIRMAKAELDWAGDRYVCAIEFFKNARIMTEEDERLQRRFIRREKLAGRGFWESIGVGQEDGEGSGDGQNEAAEEEDEDDDDDDDDDDDEGDEDEEQNYLDQTRRELEQLEEQGKQWLAILDTMSPEERQLALQEEGYYFEAEIAARKLERRKVRNHERETIAKERRERQENARQRVKAQA